MCSGGARGAVPQLPTLPQDNKVRLCTNDSVEAIKRHPLYAELVAKRKRFAWILTIIMLVIYYGFILVIAFAKEVGNPADRRVCDHRRDAGRRADHP